jgi:cell division protein FtsL
MATQALARISYTPHEARIGSVGERRTWGAVTPEVFFDKPIDNSRLVKVEDEKRKREMSQFFGATTILFALVLVYAIQHFSAIQYGYRIEEASKQREELVEMNRTLRLEEASLRSPERIDALAKQMGLGSPQAGQVMRLNATEADFGGAVVAQAAAVEVVALR